MAETKKNLYQKLVEIRKEVINFSKDTESYGYKYVSGSQAIAKIREKMDSLQVLLVPKMEEIINDTFTYTNSKGKEVTDHIVKGNMAYIWINADNPEEQLEVPWKLYGAQDDISKAYGSGLTYSERYFILKFFQAPTDELDPDKKDTSNRGKGNLGNKGLSEAQVRRLFAIANKAGYDAGIVKRQAFKKYNVTSIEVLTKKQYDELCKGYEELQKEG
ncbi:ERF family protein [Clostridium sp. MB40-C1]|uniref:ERF family protein n=1 Tax=Clostridium sp. MB40-C1 TaxID=3070996 RepID=UPI0027DF8CF8|nr:ERF family protein [Clostridium sp. MB40-C1]WMJ81942.1 ERF family protein [Clostridium sp. MB40-C1]